MEVSRSDIFNHISKSRHKNPLHLTGCIGLHRNNVIIIRGRQYRPNDCDIYRLLLARERDNEDLSLSADEVANHLTNFGILQGWVSSSTDVDFHVDEWALSWFTFSKLALFRTVCECCYSLAIVFIGRPMTLSNQSHHWLHCHWDKKM